MLTASLKPPKMKNKGETMWQSQSPTDTEVAKAIHDVLSFEKSVKRHDDTRPATKLYAPPKTDDEPDQERATGTIGWQDGRAYFLDPDKRKYMWATLSTEDTDPDDSTLEH